MLLSCCRVQLSLTLHTADLLFLHILSCKFVFLLYCSYPTAPTYTSPVYLDTESARVLSRSTTTGFELLAVPPRCSASPSKSHLLGGKVPAYSCGILLASLLVLFTFPSKPGLSHPLSLSEYYPSTKLSVFYL